MEVSEHGSDSHAPVTGVCSQSQIPADSAEQENPATFQKTLRISMILPTPMTLSSIAIQHRKRASFAKNNVNDIMVVKFA
ncbi:hypothetical protein J6590_099687 [Homalodisca vitripennis]|nr:hypothetical protein J6590_099687 [Homalodisca vitripennis]